MFKFLRRVVVALLNRFRPFRPPQDPYAAVREPRRRNPGGRSSAVAVAEPEPGNTENPGNDVRVIGRTSRTSPPLTG
jgi:hypothetical protein